MVSAACQTQAAAGAIRGREALVVNVTEKSQAYQQSDGSGKRWTTNQPAGRTVDTNRRTRPALASRNSTGGRNDRRAKGDLGGN
jgi:hypothetical protein